MFLDDKLLKHTLENDSKDIFVLLNELYKICEDHYKPQIYPKMKYEDVKLILDRTFNSWNSFVFQLKKQGYNYMVDMFNKYSFKEAFLSNEKLKEIYYS